jgi:hypothetical protein
MSVSRTVPHKTAKWHVVATSLWGGGCARLSLRKATAGAGSDSSWHTRPTPWQPHQRCVAAIVETIRP